MKKLKLLIILLFYYSCTSSVEEIYSGYLYDGKKPLQHVKIIEQTTDNFTYTDHKGSFNLKRSNVDKINDLIIKSADKKVDTIKILRGSGPGSQLRYLFLNKIPDTVDIEKERLFRKQSKSIIES